MLTGQTKQFLLESGCVYGYRKIHLDLRDTGLQCGVNRVRWLIRRAGIKAQVGYRSPRARKGEASIMASNTKLWLNLGLTSPPAEANRSEKLPLRRIEGPG